MKTLSLGVIAFFLVFGLGFGFGGFGSVATIASARQIWAGYQSSDWRHTAGTIIEQKMEYGDETQTVKVLYLYQVDDKTYEGTTIHPGYGGSSSKKKHQRIAEKLQPTRQVRVYYDPDNPTQSTLVTGIYTDRLAVLFLGLTFLPIGVTSIIGLILYLQFGNKDFADEIIVKNSYG